MTDAASRPARNAKAPPARGPLARAEAGLARIMLFPSVFIVAAIVLFPLLANFWISFKPVTLGDLRPPSVLLSDRVRATDTGFTTEWRLRNTSRTAAITNVVVGARVDPAWTLEELPENCERTPERLTCKLEELPPATRIRIRFAFAAPPDAAEKADAWEPTATGDSENILTNASFTLENFREAFSAREFWTVLRVTFVYTIFGTLAAIILGLFAALLLDRDFRGRGILRGLFLFPYVAPVIAVAFAWVILLDPFSGSVNAYLKEAGVLDGAVNFLGTRSVEIGLFGITIDFPVALSTVIAFEAWRYFPLSFLFILARMQSINTEMFEAARVDGASPFQIFRYISIPQLIGIMSVLFLLRFIWTFNKFDDIFLLTGGASGTRTLVVDVYEQAFAISNLGAGAAVAVVVFMVLLTFSLLFFRIMPKEEL
ncbi:carbohydrate ABC transporter permease [Rhodobium gokarnense]|uniref:Multiple sugar transport system permease protein n=1 Tax=Rhodobium gokarnense TaxID=364296 RepID=A0ABT3H6E0_9HYPH|nr:sugar ABC transporter permease [Rhodobium gokarnense]MCW2305944.1 multiple sugar transport system permease protein [Rhodobium gokarnense]